MTGRFPVHIVGVQADVCSNWTPLGMTLLSEKLAQAGYTSHFIGKTSHWRDCRCHSAVNVLPTTVIYCRLLSYCHSYSLMARQNQHRVSDDRPYAY